MPNPQVISQSKEPEEDRRLWKVVLLTVFTGGFLIFTSYLFNKFLLNADFRLLFLGAVSALFFLIIALLQVFFVKSRGKLAMMFFLESVAPLTIFYPRLYPEPAFILIAGALTLFIFLFFGAAHGQAVLANSLSIKFFPVARPVLRQAVTGLLLYLTVLLYLNYFVWGNFNEKLAKIMVNETLSASEPVTRIFLPNITFQQSTGDFFKTIAENQLREIKSLGVPESGGFNFQLLPPPEKAKVINEAAGTLEKEIEKIVGPLDPAAPAKDTVYKIIKDYLLNLPPALDAALGLIVALSFFFLIKGTAVLFYWLIEILAFALFKFLLIVGFAYISLESRSREFIMLS